MTARRLGADGDPDEMVGAFLILPRPRSRTFEALILESKCEVPFECHVRRMAGSQDAPGPVSTTTLFFRLLARYPFSHSR